MKIYLFVGSWFDGDARGLCLTLFGFGSFGLDRLVADSLLRFGSLKFLDVKKLE